MEEDGGGFDWGYVDYVSLCPTQVPQHPTASSLDNHILLCGSAGWKPTVPILDILGG